MWFSHKDTKYTKKNFTKDYLIFINFVPLCLGGNIFFLYNFFSHEGSKLTKKDVIKTKIVFFICALGVFVVIVFLSTDDRRGAGVQVGDSPGRIAEQPGCRSLNPFGGRWTQTPV